MAAETDALLRLAAPLILTALVNMGISLTDVLMMGWLGPTEMAAGAAVSDFYSVFFYLAAGVLAAVSPLVAQARGARTPREVRRATRQGFWAALLLSLPGALIVWHADRAMAWLGVAPQVVDTGAPYARMMALTLVPMLGVMVWRNFLAAHDRPRVIFLVTITALPLNALGNWLLMFGPGGLPALGLAGAGLSSALVATYMFAMLTLYVQRDRRLLRYHLFVRFHRADWARLREIFRIGTPIGISHLGEMGVFLLATVITGILGAEALAAHTVTLRMAGLLYAVPLGLTQAATIRVGYAVGAGRPEAVGLTTRTVLILALAVGLLYLVLLGAARPYIPGLFLDAGATPASVLSTATLLLGLLALMMPVDGLGTVACGVLRGHKDTQVPMLISLAAFWGVGFTGGLWLAFPAGLGVYGIWLGLTAGTVVMAAGTLARLWWRTRLPAAVAAPA